MQILQRRTKYLVISDSAALKFSPRWQVCHDLFSLTIQLVEKKILKLFKVYAILFELKDSLAYSKITDDGYIQKSVLKYPYLIIHIQLGKRLKYDNDNDNDNENNFIAM